MFNVDIVIPLARYKHNHQTLPRICNPEVYLPRLLVTSVINFITTYFVTKVYNIDYQKNLSTLSSSNGELQPQIVNTKLIET